MDFLQQREMPDGMDRSDSFMDRLKECAAYPLRAQSVDVLQINVTRRCNLCCRHCHVESSSDRTEELSRENMEACLQAATRPEITTLDITGGSPEMHSHLAWFIKQAASIGKRLIVRSNGAILLDDPYRQYLDIYADNGVVIIVSLPNPLAEQTNRMRGPGVFERIIAALKELNRRGYGDPAGDRILNLVHNPVGAFLPGSQQALENEYRSRLRRDYGVEFNELYCLTNCPVGRYLDFLKRSGNLTDYMNLLKQSFNPKTVPNIMCRTTLSVGVDGRLFDCDFNQVLDLSLSNGAPAHIRDFNIKKLARREIVVRSHCFACTAGAGSSCQGTLK